MPHSLACWYWDNTEYVIIFTLALFLFVWLFLGQPKAGSKSHPEGDMKGWHCPGHPISSVSNCVIASNSQGKSCSTEHVALSPHVVLSLIGTVVTFPCRQRFYLIMNSVRKEERCILLCFVLVRDVFIYFEVSWILKQAWFLPVFPPYPQPQ